MMGEFKTLLVGIIIVTLFINFTSGKHHPRKIYLKKGTIDTRLSKQIIGSPPTIFNSFLNSMLTSFVGNFEFIKTNPSKTDKNEVKTVLVHFKKHFNHKIEDELKKYDVIIGDYLPHNTHIVTGKIKDLEKIKEEMKEVLWIGELDHKHKMHDEHLLNEHLGKHEEVVLEKFYKKQIKDANKKNIGTRNLQSSVNLKENIHYTILASVGEHKNLDTLKNLMTPVKVNLQKEFGKNFINLVVASTRKIGLGVLGKETAVSVSKWLTKQHFIHWVEVKPPTRKLNRFAAMLIQSYTEPTKLPLWARGINGDGQIIGIGDTGLDTFHCFFYDETNPIPYYERQYQPVVPSKHRKIHGFFSFMDKSDSFGGHGTHVSGTATGQAHPTLSPDGISMYNSPSFGSKIAFMDCGCDTDAGCPCPSDVQCECDLKEGGVCPRRFGVVYLPLDLDQGFFPWYYAVGARVQSNSWGTGYYSDFNFGYSTSSADIDRFAWNNKDFLPFFAAGNSGGQYGYSSLTSESEAKNTVVVGATQSLIDAWTSINNFTDFTTVVDNYKVELFKTYCTQSSSTFNEKLCEDAKKFTQADCCNDEGKCNPPSETCCGIQKFPDVHGIGFKCCPACMTIEMGKKPAHYNPNNMALFTARGPAIDGRIKPDVVTVGDFVVSAKSLGTLPTSKCDRSQKFNDILTKKEGTSMASPVAATAAILIRQYYTQGFYPTGDKNEKDKFEPSAALVKATLIHSTREMTGSIYLMSKHVWWNLNFNEGQRFRLRKPYFQGFGHIELNTALSKDAGLYLPYTRDRQLTTGEVHTYCMHVLTGGKPLKATLVWTDAPSTPSAQINLVNDLDLIVIGPDRKVYYGNGIYSTIGSARDEPDFQNNVEQFYMESPPSGKYNVVVRGKSIPKGPQPYALVLSGQLSPTSLCEEFTELNLNPSLSRYVSLSYAFGMLCVFLIPALALLALYFFYQYRQVTTRSDGYKRTYLKNTDQGKPINSDSTDYDVLEDDSKLINKPTTSSNKV